jgi:hypothetical protein
MGITRFLLFRACSFSLSLYIDNDIMTNVQLYAQISSLPSDLKKEVSDFVAFLKQKSKAGKKIKERQFGYSKDFFKVADDFDEPLEDFKEYM